MNCENCGVVIPHGFVDCPDCTRVLEDGVRLAPPSTRVGNEDGVRRAGECPKCGVKNPPESSHCSGCESTLPKPRLLIKKASTGQGFIARSRHIKHFIICPPIEPIELDESREYVLGRSADVDLMLPGELVSRRHAVLSCRDGTWHLSDEDSGNGTYCNGRRIATTIPIDDGDRISVGGYYMAYKVKRGMVSADQAGLEQVTKASTTRVSSNGGLCSEIEQLLPYADLYGRLDKVSLLEVLCILHIGEYSGDLMVFQDGIGTGGLEVAEGEFVTAWTLEASPSLGEQAIQKLTRMTPAQFVFLAKPFKGRREIEIPSSELLEILRSGESLFSVH